MNTVYHILGTDIPHHNRTLLEFFRQQILPQQPADRHHFYVVGGADLTAEFPTLSLTLFRSQKAVAQALFAKLKKIIPPASCCTGSLTLGSGF